MAAAEAWQMNLMRLVVAAALAVAFVPAAADAASVTVCADVQGSSTCPVELASPLPVEPVLCASQDASLGLAGVRTTACYP